MRQAIIVAGIALGGCGGFAGPHAAGVPCAQISEARFGDLVDAGATRANATVSASGTVSMTTGPGIVHCANGPQPRACRRPNEFVIRYTMADGARKHVHIPAGEQYRFRVGTCEVIPPMKV